MSAPKLDFEAQIRAQLLILRLVAGSMVASLLVMGAWLVFQPPAPAGVEPSLPIILASAALVESPVIFVMRYVLMKTVALMPPSDLRVDSALEGAALTDALRTARGKYQVGTLVGLAFAQSIGIYGFVASFVTAELSWFVGLAAWSILLQLVQFPRRDGLLCVLSPEGRKGLERATR